MVLAKYSAVSSGLVIPAKRPNDQPSELIGIKYLKQKQRIESEIGCWKERIHSEEVRELLESWYC